MAYPLTFQGKSCHECGLLRHHKKCSKNLSTFSEKFTNRSSVCFPLRHPKTSRACVIHKHLKNQSVDVCFKAFVRPESLPYFLQWGNSLLLQPYRFFFLLYILCIVTLFVFIGRALQLNYCQFFFDDPSKFEFLTSSSSLVANTTFFK